MLEHLDRKRKIALWICIVAFILIFFFAIFRATPEGVAFFNLVFGTNNTYVPMAAGNDLFAHV